MNSIDLFSSLNRLKEELGTLDPLFSNDNLLPSGKLNVLLKTHLLLRLFDLSIEILSDLAVVLFDLVNFVLQMLGS